jgi:hypothetical protein
VLTGFVAGLHDLKFQARILHRDVSHNNIMFQVRDGKPYFILNDFDLATVEKAPEEESPTSKHRTGTLAFMCLELLLDLANETPGNLPVFPRLRYDFESLFWVALWCAITMEAVDDELRARVRTEITAWEAGTFHKISSHKHSMLFNPGQFDRLPLTPKFQHLRGWLNRWRRLIKLGEDVRNSYADDLEFDQTSTQPIDLDTLNGRITRETIKAALAGERPTV